MNNLKFRVYNKELNRFLSKEEYCLDFDGKLIFVEMELNCKCGDKVKLCAVPQELYIVQQFTGLIDKNNKEIYEGDFVNFHYFGFDGSETDNQDDGVVEYTDSFYGFGINNGTRIFTFTETSHFGEPCIEIIGNVCQNKKLIK